MTVQNSTYKECNISVDVTGPDASGAYTGSFVITHEVGDADDDKLFTPVWRSAAYSEAEAIGRLTQMAQDIIDGKGDASDIENA
ncbi:hypothetical protein [Caballeronia sp. INDeC2]|uniref:hypothetical protein n=1 Tax=Caballeronia sp. INDeC2 TaxID=2921747 RepID=UPI00202831C4|nr:hypothetical protein [Caballeronia sp. INDeC2]